MACFFDSSGKTMFIPGNDGDDVNEYTLATAWDVSSASFVDSFSIVGQDTSPQGIAFSKSGMKMFIAGNTGNDVNEYTLSTAWDVSSASFVDSFSVASEGVHLLTSYSASPERKCLSRITMVTK